MSRRTTALALSLLAVLWAYDRPAVGGQMSTPLQTRSIPMTATDWGSGTGGITDPMVFSQFNSKLGTLDAVDITLSSTITNDFELIFVKTPIPTTLFVATTATSDPSVLSDPSKVQQLTDGPTDTLKAPDGLTTIFGGPGATLPVDVVTLTEVSGTWSSYLPPTNPNYIAPSSATLSLSRTLDASNAASLLPEFIGTGSIDLPVSSIAHSSFYSDSGNGGGIVRTSASATVTLQYWYTPGTLSVPEPSGLVLLGLGTGLVALAARRRGRS